ncbi:phage tail tape measure protein [Methylobacterium dankookense]|uniref:Phage tail tape measure protein domain-containing protein n=1 Tax=Methylobacterium dankookense TaxID=560405 RepID=A0A564G245_9HYPH|nr:phage tail tape measure protein [Methylobacterium dankookense]GJD58257.1 hypothetical protein IFDJLNFL_4174 [Methylobacterium dankookense]VUF14174.1 hypothetical protein MTDSW087_03890 [Methylobacterium dankookense]
MTVEELIAKLGFKATGMGEARKFVAELERVKKAAREAGKGLKLNFSGNTSGLGKLAAEFERAARNARRFRQEAERASRVRFRPGSGPGADGGGKVRPGDGGYGPGHIAAGVAAGRFSRAQAAVGGAAVAAVGAITLKRYGNLEQAATELGITAGKTAEEVKPTIEMFEREAPKLGVTAQNMTEVAQAFAAAGIDYETAVQSAVATTKAARASYTDMNDAAQAGIVTIQNLGVKIKDIKTAYDYMIAGGKLGKAEFKELSGAMPQLASSGAKIGLKDLPGLRDIVAALEVVREASATTGDAAIHLKDFFEKMNDPVTRRYFKKHAGIDVEKEMASADKKGQSRLDRMLDITQRFTKGNPFRLAELWHEQQSRDAIQQLLTKRDKFDEFRQTIDKTAPGTTEVDLARVMDTFNASVDKFSASVDRLADQIGEKGSPFAKAILDIGSAALQAAEDGKGSTDAERNATVSKLNRIFGKPNLGSPEETARKLGYPGARNNDLLDRFRNGMSGPKRPTFTQPQPSGMTMPNFGSLGDRLGWIKQGMAQVTHNVTNNSDVGNDHRTQSVTVNQTVNGVPGVAQAAAAGAKSGLSSMGPSITKGNLTSTGATTSP